MVPYSLGDHDQDAETLRSLLAKLTDAVTTDQDPFQLIQKAVRGSQLAEAGEALSLKPGVMGISVDLRSVWQAMKKYLRDEARVHKS